MRPWLEARGATITYTRFFSGEVIPALDGIDLLVVMGGPMSVNDEATLPWLVAEKSAIREAVRDGIPLLGVCLGAQLIASALGARVYPNRTKEIGWHPISAVDGGADTFRLPAECRVFQWHGETFDLPRGAVRIAASAACANQAFQLGRRVLALQFHLETTPATAEAMLVHCRDELVPAPCVQREHDIRAATTADYARINALAGEVLDYLVGG